MKQKIMEEIYAPKCINNILFNIMNDLSERGVWSKFHASVIYDFIHEGTVLIKIYMLAF